MPQAPKPVRVPDLLEKKQRGEKIAVLTAYDATMARLLDCAGVDILLVGDSLGMVVMGHQNTLEVTLDNFCEIEHTPTTHDFFGYDPERMHEVQVRFEPTETSVRVINVGPPKRIGLIYRFLLGIKRTWQFNDDWTTYFSPVYSVYDHWWSDPASGRDSRVRWRLYIFFTPLDDEETAITTFAFTKSRYWGPQSILWVAKWLIRKKLDHEIRLDVRILEGLADQRADLEGMKLSRFDKALGLNRERIERVYRGRTLQE